MIQSIVLPVDTTMTYVSRGDERTCCQLRVGSRGNVSYWSYLHFDMTQLKQRANIAYAKIVLFKEPIEYGKPIQASYQCVPAKDYMTPYSYCYAPPVFETSYEVTFEVDPGIAYVEIDVTDMVKAWTTGGIKDRGVVICGEAHASLSSFGTEDNATKNMRPILEVGIYEEDIEPINSDYSFPIQIKISS